MDDEDGHFTSSTADALNRLDRDEQLFQVRQDQISQADEKDNFADQGTIFGGAGLGMSQDDLGLETSFGVRIGLDDESLGLGIRGNDKIMEEMPESPGKYFAARSEALTFPVFSDPSPAENTYQEHDELHLNHQGSINEAEESMIQENEGHEKPYLKWFVSEIRANCTDLVPEPQHELRFAIMADSRGPDGPFNMKLVPIENQSRYLKAGWPESYSIQDQSNQSHRENLSIVDESCEFDLGGMAKECAQLCSIDLVYATKEQSKDSFEIQARIQPRACTNVLSVAEQREGWHSLPAEQAPKFTRIMLLLSTTSSVGDFEQVVTIELRCRKKQGMDWQSKDVELFLFGTCCAPQWGVYVENQFRAYSQFGDGQSNPKFNAESELEFQVKGLGEKSFHMLALVNTCESPIMFAIRLDRPSWPLTSMQPDSTQRREVFGAFTLDDWNEYGKDEKPHWYPALWNDEKPQDEYVMLFVAVDSNSEFLFCVGFDAVREVASGERLESTLAVSPVLNGLSGLILEPRCPELRLVANTSPWDDLSSETSEPDQIRAEVLEQPITDLERQRGQTTYSVHQFRSSALIQVPNWLSKGRTFMVLSSDNTAVQGKLRVQVRNSGQSHAGLGISLNHQELSVHPSRLALQANQSGEFWIYCNSVNPGFARDSSTLSAILEIEYKSIQDSVTYQYPVTVNMKVPAKSPVIQTAKPISPVDNMSKPSEHQARTSMGEDLRPALETTNHVVSSSCLLCDEPVVSFGGIIVTKDIVYSPEATRSLTIRNISSGQLQVTLRIPKSDLDIFTFLRSPPQQGGQAEQLQQVFSDLDPESVLTVHVHFHPRHVLAYDSFIYVVERLKDEASGSDTMFKIPLRGYGGKANLEITPTVSQHYEFLPSLYPQTLSNIEMKNMALLVRNIGDRCGYFMRIIQDQTLVATHGQVIRPGASFLLPLSNDSNQQDVIIEWGDELARRRRRAYFELQSIPPDALCAILPDESFDNDAEVEMRRDRSSLSSHELLMQYYDSKLFELQRHTILLPSGKDAWTINEKDGQIYLRASNMPATKQSSPQHQNVSEAPVENLSIAATPVGWTRSSLDIIKNMNKDSFVSWKIVPADLSDQTNANTSQMSSLSDYLSLDIETDRSQARIAPGKWSSFSFLFSPTRAGMHRRRFLFYSVHDNRIARILDVSAEAKFLSLKGVSSSQSDESISMSQLIDSSRTLLAFSPQVVDFQLLVSQDPSAEQSNTSGIATPTKRHSFSQGKLSTTTIKLCNRSGKAMELVLSSVCKPFIVEPNRMRLPPRSYVRIPISVDWNVAEQMYAKIPHRAQAKSESYRISQILSCLTSDGSSECTAILRC